MRIIGTKKALLHWLARQPLWFLHTVGAALGWLAYGLSARYRQLLRENATTAGLSTAQRRASIAEAGRLYAELPRVWLRPPEQPLPDPVIWQGEDLMEAAMGSNAPLIILTPHLGCFEVIAQAYAQRFGPRKPMTALYRPARQAWLSELQLTARTRPHLHSAPANLAGVRQLLRVLREGQTVGLLPDQVPPDGQGVWAPFFGREAYTMTLAARLARQTRATVLALWCERLRRGAGYVIHVGPMAQPWSELTLDDEQAAVAVNASMEALIRQCPSQYLWAYDRYKSPRASH